MYYILYTYIYIYIGAWSTDMVFSKEHFYGRHRQKICTKR